MKCFGSRFQVPCQERGVSYGDLNPGGRMPALNRLWKETGGFPKNTDGFVISFSVGKFIALQAECVNLLSNVRRKILTAKVERMLRHGKIRKVLSSRFQQTTTLASRIPRLTPRTSD